MTTNEEKNMKMLLERGMDQKEAGKFLDGRNVITKGLQLPAEHALELMNQMVKYGMFTGPVRFFVVIAEDNEQRLLDLLNSTGEDVAVEGRFDTGDVNKDPIGDYNRQIQDGYSGSADFEGTGSKLIN